MTENMESLGDILRRLTQKSTFAASESGGAGEPDPDLSGRCPICQDKGWVVPDLPPGHANFGKAFPCGCQEERLRRERTERLLRYSNLDQLARFTLESLSPKGRSDDPESQKLFQRAYQAALNFATEPKGWLVLAGPVGCGKTHLAAAIGQKLIKEGRPVFYVSVPDLLDHLRSTFGPSSEISYDEMFEQVRNAQVLILDDLGMQSATPWAQEKLYQILNHRFNLEMATVITTDKPLSELDEPLRLRLSDGTVSTVYEVEKRREDLHPMLGEVEPEMLKRMRFDTFDIKGNNADPEGRQTLEAALSAARNFAKDPEGWLIFVGTTGCGKTHLAVAMANEWIKGGRSVVFSFVPNLLDHLRHTFSPESRVTYDELFEQIKTAPLLILDDLGSEATTPWAEEKLYQIIVHRHNGRLPTVITSRRRPSEGFTSGPLNEPISSRLKDSTGFNQLVRIAAPDYRDKERRPEGYASKGRRPRQER